MTVISEKEFQLQFSKKKKSTQPSYTVYTSKTNIQISLIYTKWQLALKFYHAFQQKNIYQKIVTILLRLFAHYTKSGAQQQWIETQVFAISSHIYQTAPQNYLLLHKISVPQSFGKTQLSKHHKNLAKASATVMSKTDYGTIA